MYFFSPSHTRTHNAYISTYIFKILHLYFNMASDHIIYLTSSGSQDLYPNNNPGNFVNRLSTPVILDTNTEYEVGLVSILYPDQYYAILANNENYNIIVYTYQKNIPTTTLEVKMNKNILAGNMGKIVKIVNDNLLQYMEAHYHQLFPHLFSKDEKIICWNDTERRVEILSKQSNPEVRITRDIKKNAIKLNQGLASVLGYDTRVQYAVYSQRKSLEIYKSSFPPSPRCGVDYIYLYTDIIQPSNFGGQLVNILDCFTLQNGGNKGIHNSVYKTLNTSFIDQISIDIRDQKGRRIYFLDDSTLTCALHIRPK